MRIYAIVDGVTYDLNYGDPAHYEADDGLGMPDLRRLEERGPMQHGSSDRGYRLEPRYASYIFGVSGWTKAELWDKRQALLRIFRPSRPIIMKHVLDNGDVRYLDCLFSGGMKMPSADRRGLIFQKLAVTLKADDPTYYDPEGESLTFALGGGGDAWEFPWEIPWGVGASTIDATTDLEYEGDVATYPTIIRITGPVDDPILTNLSTGEKLDFTGASITGGNYYDIDLRYGFKTIVDSTGADVLSDLTSDSDLATFHLAADDEVPDGINTLRFQGDVVTESTKVEISYLNRYSGI